MVVGREFNTYYGCQFPCQSRFWYATKVIHIVPNGLRLIVNVTMDNIENKDNPRVELRVMQRGKYGYDQFDDKPIHKGNQIAVVQPGSPLSFELNGAMDGDRVVGVRPMHTGIGTDTLNSGRGELHVETRE
jgi:hypothetical protein